MRARTPDPKEGVGESPSECYPVLCFLRPSPVGDGRRRRRHDAVVSSAVMTSCTCLSGRVGWQGAFFSRAAVRTPEPRRKANVPFPSVALERATSDAVAACLLSHASGAALNDVRASSSAFSSLRSQTGARVFFFFRACGNGWRVF